MLPFRTLQPCYFACCRDGSGATLSAVFDNNLDRAQARAAHWKKLGMAAWVEMVMVDQ